jgi:hypothetical protein
MIESALAIQVKYDSHESTFLFSKKDIIFLPFGGGKGEGGEWGGDGGGVVLGEEEY